jgi:hypothetical protein
VYIAWLSLAAVILYTGCNRFLVRSDLVPAWQIGPGRAKALIINQQYPFCCRLESPSITPATTGRQCCCSSSKNSSSISASCTLTAGAKSSPAKQRTSHQQPSRTGVVCCRVRPEATHSARHCAMCALTTALLCLQGCLAQQHSPAYRRQQTVQQAHLPRSSSTRRHPRRQPSAAMAVPAARQRSPAAVDQLPVQKQPASWRLLVAAVAAAGPAAARQQLPGTRLSTQAVQQQALQGGSWQD